jgi:hypothetical protein
MTAPLLRSADIEQVLALLVTAQAHIHADRLADAAATYRLALAEPALDAHPAARCEVCANFGALMLHDLRLDSAAPDAVRRLDEAIELLLKARADYGLAPGEGLRVTNDTNLALAYLQRYQLSGHHGDLLSAHMALDGAEARVDGKEAEMCDWVRSIRDTLVEQVDRRRTPR